MGSGRQRGRIRDVGKSRASYKKQSVNGLGKVQYPPLLRRKIPIRHSPIPQIPPNQNVDAADHMPHHAIPRNNHLLEPAQDLADLLGREPTHIASPGHVRGVEADTATSGHCLDQGPAVGAERGEGGVEIEGGDVASVAVFVVGEGVCCVGIAIREGLGGLEGGVGEESGVLIYEAGEVVWAFWLVRCQC